MTTTPPTAVDQDAPWPGSAPAHRRRSGWLVGFAVGILAVLWMFPLVRYTLYSQFEFAYAVNDIPWIRALNEQQSVREISRLDAAADSDPENYALQLGRATALAEFYRSHAGAAVNGDILVRLGKIAQNFPNVPGAYAHLARYMMVDQIRIQRVELAGQPLQPTVHTKSTPSPRILTSPRLTHSIPAPRAAVKLMEWALRSGERRDPDNAFWPTLLAATYFAAERDQAGLSALARAARRTHWDAYVYQEVLGQWQLYSTAYGDNGAAQRIGPLSLVAFPHLREIRQMAEIARFLSERDAGQGKVGRAISTRRNLAQLGILMRDRAQWAYEALYGTDIFFLASTDSNVIFTSSAIRDKKQWEMAAAPYFNLLHKNNKLSEDAWLRQEAQDCIDLRQMVDVARYDASYPGIPPGIPLPPLFASWMAGAYLVQQMFGLAAISLLVALILRVEPKLGRHGGLLRALAWTTVLVLTAASALWLEIGLPTPNEAALMLFGGVLLFALLVQQLAGNGKNTPEAVRRSPSGMGLRAAVESHWTAGTTARMLALLLIPGLSALYFLRYTLSGLHPVAMLLAGLMGSVLPPTPAEVTLMALLGFAVPLAMMALAALWGAYRRVSPLAAVVVALRRLTVPAILCLAGIYLGLLQSTLRLDRQASQAIDKAAQNDRTWVLSHGEPQAPGP